MKHPASRRRYRWDDPAPPTLVVGAARTGWSRVLRRSVTLPKIAAALVGVVSIATIGGLVFIVASSLPARHGGSVSVAQGEDVTAATPVASIDAAPAIATGKPEQVAAVADKTSRSAAAQVATPAATVASDMTATVRPRPAPIEERAAETPEAAFAENGAPTAGGAAAAVAAIAEQAQPAEKPMAARPEIKPEAVKDEPGRQRLALTVPDRPKASEAEAPASGKKTVVNSAVNMRRTAKGSVMMVIPAGAEVSLAGSCDHWCQVTYKGQTGFVYRSFIRR